MWLLLLLHITLLHNIALPSPIPLVVVIFLIINQTTIFFIYNGNVNIKLGNGAGMTISHIGFASCLSSTTHTPFSFYDLLHVPDINKNFLKCFKVWP